MPTPRWLRVVLILGCVARLAVVAARLSHPLSGDELSYDSIAFNLATGHGYSVGSPEGGYAPTAVRAPGYVLFLAAFYRVFGRHPLPPLLAQALLDVLTTWLIARLARRWFGDGRVALAAAAAYAFYPPFVLDTAHVLSETTSQFLVVATVFLFFEHVATRRAAPLVGSGIALGLCALSKPQLLPLGVVLAVASIPVLSVRAAARAAMTLCLLAGLVLAPWVLRNESVFHAFVPGVSTGGIALWFGAAPYGHPIGGFDDPSVPDSLRRRLVVLSEAEQNRWALAEAKRIIAADPAGYARLTLSKVPRLWFNLGFEGHAPSRASLLIAAANLLLWGLAVAGALRLPPAAPATAVMVALALFWTAVHAPFFTVVRYAEPYYALLLPFCAAGLVGFLPWSPRG
jgi:4-amino-4-deoxy-L-arabinose transferase-like glycosyltransferase